MKNREPIFWDTPDRENLRYSTESDAIEGILDDLEKPFPEIIEIAGFARMVPSEGYFCILDDVLERLDEEFGDPDGDHFEPTPAMKEAEKAFVEVIRREYKPWMCEEVCRKTINVAEWIKQNRPDWK